MMKPYSIELLKQPLSDKSVRTRQGRGKQQFSYLEAWKVIEEANRIFGHDGWSRETLGLMQIGQVHEYKDESNRDRFAVAYRAEVRVTIGDIVRTGNGFGSDTGYEPLGIHELAIKEAESDAMKRAFMTFGHPLGLALYDKKQANVMDIPVKITDEQYDLFKDLLDKSSDRAKIWFEEKYGNIRNIPGNVYPNLLKKFQKGLENADT